MNDVKNLLAVTFVVITAGSAIYTIKTYMQPGMKIAINLAELKELDDETEDSFTQSTKFAKLTTTAATITATATLPTTVTTSAPTTVNATTFATTEFETTNTDRTTVSNMSSTNSYTEETLSISLETESEVVNEDNQREIEGPPLNTVDMSIISRQNKPQLGLKKLIRDLSEKDCDSKKSIVDANVKNISKTP